MKPEKKKILLLSGGAVGKVRSVLQALNLEDLTIHKGGDLMIQDEGDLCGSDWMLLLEVTHLVYSVGSVMEEMFDKRKALFEGLTCKEVDAFIETNLMEPQQVSEAMPELEPIKKVVWVCAELTVEIAYGRTAASIRRRSLRMYRRFMDSAFDTCLDTVFQNALKDEDEGEGSNEPENATESGRMFIVEPPDDDLYLAALIIARFVGVRVLVAEGSLPGGWWCSFSPCDGKNDVARISRKDRDTARRLFLAAHAQLLGEQ